MATAPDDRLREVLKPGDTLIVIHDFDARSPDELTLKRSERLELIELDEGFGDGWYLGRHLTRGITGLFPGVYTTKALPPSTRTPIHSRNTSLQKAVSPTITRSDALATSKFPDTMPTAVTSDRSTLPAQSPSVVEDMRFSLPTVPKPSYHSPTVRNVFKDDRDEQNMVMNDTLNVIDEHIIDLSSSKQDVRPQYLQVEREHDSDSEYSSHMGRASFVAGPETDEEDSSAVDESLVRSWTAAQTAQHLRELGIDPKHCEIFRQQEITGDVILDMDQNFIYMKEYDFGVMGKRLKTWHIIRDFQNAVKGSTQASTIADDNSSDGSRSAAFNSSTSRLTALQDRGLGYLSAQHTPPIAEEDDDMPHPLQTSNHVKRASLGPMATSSHLGNGSPEQRDMNLVTDSSRRHSSIDFGQQPNLTLSDMSSPASHQKQSSLDQSWSLAGSTLATTPTSSFRADDSIMLPPPVEDTFKGELDRGYFSGNELDNIKARGRLSKNVTGSTVHSRQTSLQEQQNKRALMKHKRMSSDGSGFSSSARGYYALATKSGKLRSASARQPSGDSTGPFTPTVTNLESSSPTINSTTQEKTSMQDRARRLVGLRTSSEAVTSAEKLSKAPIFRATPSPDTLASPQTMTSNTPPFDVANSETTSVSGDRPSPALLSKMSMGTLRQGQSPTMPQMQRPRIKAKQKTSAYTHGLMKIAPAEARQHADYSGWMKKKSSSLMTTWKARLFILRGRRLSYYYSENDTEERGIIDISGYKVLVANNEAITTLHATMTGANKPSPGGTTTNHINPVLTTPGIQVAPPPTPRKPSDTGSFFFKLVPPRAHPGRARAVQFTKPMIHYFQCDNAALGRKWMGELMKATIEHDFSTLETTNKQKTISLKQARAQLHRPPELDDTKKIGGVAEEEEERPPTVPEKEQGLGVSGAGLQSSTVNFPSPNASSNTYPGTGSTASTPLQSQVGLQNAASQSQSARVAALAAAGIKPTPSQRNQARLTPQSSASPIIPEGNKENAEQYTSLS